MKQLPLNWFDFVALAILVIGMIRGRKRGMSEELLPLLKWLAIVFVGGQFYQPFGALISKYTHFGQLVSFVTAYLVIMAAIFGIFAFIKRLVGEKLLSADLFGRFEYYMGLVAGMVRWFCMLFTVLAFINARQITDDELAKQIKQDLDVYGSTYFPRFGAIQRDIFRNSMSGPYLMRYMGRWLISPSRYEDVMDERNTIGGKAREREIDDVMKKK